MSYLLDSINSELLQRIDEMAPKVKNWLQIDFEDSTLALPGQSQMDSLLALGGAERLAGLPAGSFDGMVVNLQLAWLDPGDTLSDSLRLLKPGGHLFFTTFGPDTLFELREAWAAEDSAPHVHPFPDMHHLGDLLVRNGLEKPIVDSDWVGVQYDDSDLLMQDLRAAGFHNVMSDRRKTLTGKDRLQRVRERLARSGAPLNITWEIVFGYAMQPSRGRKDGVQVNFSG